MQESTKSRILLTQSSSGKPYFVKRKHEQKKESRQPKDYFKSPQHKLYDFSGMNKNSSTISIINDESLSLSKIDISIGKVSPQNSSIPNRQNSQPFFLNESQVKKKSRQNMKTLISMQNSQESLINTIIKKKKKKYLFETICDKSFNKSLVRKQILIEDESINPQNVSVLPKLSKNALSDSKGSMFQNKLALLSLSRNNSMISQSDPFYKIRQQVKDKFSIQKMKDYRKIWVRKEKRRNQLNESLNNGINHRTLSYNASILNKSNVKSNQIVSHYNKDVELKKAKSYWEEQLRGRQKKYVTIGHSTNRIPVLKGNGQDSYLNIQVTPVYNNKKKGFFCEEVYKFHK